MVLSLGACNTRPAGTPTSPAATTPATATLFSPTATLTIVPSPSNTAPTTPTLAASATPILTLTPATGTPQGTSQFSTSGDSAAFVSDVTIPDGTNFNPGDHFTKTWRLSNNGSTTWSTSYSLVYIRGSLTSSVLSIPLPVEVPSGKTVDLSVSFTAPAAAGQYTSLWMLKNSAGQLFGIGPAANQPFFVLINVGSSTNGTATLASSTPGSSSTPGGLAATAATLSVDTTSYSGACPFTLNLSGSITSSGIGTMMYELEAGSNTAGFTFTLPGPQSEVYTAGGSHTLPVSYYLNISSSVSGWVRLYISAPNTLRSTQVNFTITCN